MGPLKPVTTVVPPQGVPSYMLPPTFGALSPLPPGSSSPPIKAPPALERKCAVSGDHVQWAAFLQHMTAPAMTPPSQIEDRTRRLRALEQIAVD